jgi:predicted AAA+ superfamily ATPase
LNDGPRLRTLWGYLASRIAGEAGLRLVAEAEAARTNPGSELMVEVFRLAGPSVILLDELVMFARQLDDIRLEAFLSFIQSLTEAAKMVPGVLIIGSLPESDAEAGGARGREALLRLEKVFGRVQSPWLPASGNETYEIVRRRLFQALDPESERARDETVKAFAISTAANLPSSRPRRGRRATPNCCAYLTRFIPSCSTDCPRNGRAWRNFSVPATCCALWRMSSACSGRRRRAIR